MWHKGLDIARIVITKSDGSSFDVTERLSTQPVIKQAVNNETVVTFSIVNDVDDEKKNILSDVCELWNGPYKGALSVGDHVTVDYENEEIEIFGQRLASGIIATITAHWDVIDITVVDCIAELKKIGATYFRNHYQHDALVESTLDVGSDHDQYPFYIIKLESTPLNSVRFARNETFTPTGPEGAMIRIQSGVVVESIYNKGDGWAFGCQMSFGRDGGLGAASVNVSIRENNENGKILFSGKHTISVSITWNIDFEPTNAQNIYFRVTTSNLTPRVTPKINNNGTYRVSGGSWSNGTIFNSMKITKYYNVNGVSGNPNQYITREGKQFPIYRMRGIDINGTNTPLAPQDLIPNTFQRGWASWQASGSRILSRNVMRDILDAHDYRMLGGGTTSVLVNKFLCGGDFVYNYLMAMADMENDPGTAWEGHQSVIAASVHDDDVITLSRRMKVTEAPRFSLSFAGDKRNDGSTWMKTFNPVLTMANRPVTSFVQGQTGEEDGNIPIMIAVSDIRRMEKQGGPLTPMPTVNGELTGSIDLSSVAFDSNVSSIIDAARQAYADIIEHANLIDGKPKWEGVVELSGIHNAFVDNPDHRGYIDLDIGSPTYGSGVSVVINDMRYGMKDYKALVKECVYDFTDLTTKITLSNYSIANNNVVHGNTKMGIRAGNIATDAINDNLFLRQYVLVRTKGAMLPPLGLGQSNRIRIHGLSGNYEDQSAMTLYFPELKMTLLSAHFPPNPNFGVINHGIIGVSYHNPSDDYPIIPIKESRRPDKYVTQSLTVNIQVQHP